MKHIASVFAAALTMLLTNGLVFAQDTTLTITSGGNVGIGTTAPTYKLELKGNFRALNPNADFTFDGFAPFRNTTLAGTFSGFNGYGPQLRFEGAPAGFMDIGQDSSGNFVIESQDVPRVVVQPSGNVGIGTTSPPIKLTIQTAVNQHGLLHTDGTHNLITWLGTSEGTEGAWIGPTSPHALSLQTSNLARLTVSASGNVGIGTVSPDQQLSVNGNASKVGGGSWATFSDRRVKQDINAFSDGLSVLKGIRPVTFRYNGKLGYPADKTYVGVIAQEIQSVAPYTVDTYRAKLDPDDAEETDILRFDGSALTYIAINAIKELDAKVDELRVLQKENHNLASRLSQLEALVKSLAAEKTNVGDGSLSQLR